MQNLKEYSPGSIWKTRKELFGLDEKNKRVIIPYKSYVFLVKHFVENDEVIVLFEKKTIYLKEDIGHVFDLEPELPQIQ